MNMALGKFERDRTVFINCPYDDEYRPIFDMIILSVVICGYYPDCADSGVKSKPRVERIAEGVSNAKYSLHDLSRCRGEGEENLSRLNMPLELGFAMAQKLFGGPESNDHDWNVLVPKDTRYEKYISDLGGYDLLRYEETSKSAVQAVLAWLTTQTNAILYNSALSPSDVLRVEQDFIESLSALRAEWGDHLSWGLLVGHTINFASVKGLIPSLE